MVWERLQLEGCQPRVLRSRALDLRDSLGLSPKEYPCPSTAQDLVKYILYLQELQVGDLASSNAASWRDDDASGWTYYGMMMTHCYDSPISGCPRVTGQRVNGQRGPKVDGQRADDQRSNGQGSMSVCARRRGDIMA